MQGRRLIVLKFGGSVLRDECSLRSVVHEVHRWRREGYDVLAVVSALAGATEALLARARAVAPDADDCSVAATIAAGEHEAAALLGLCLDRAGVPARVLSPAALGLVAEGPPLDADPVRLEGRRIRAALAADAVVVVPGFAALDDAGRTVVLGRGGSDLTALFLAHRLGAARCRLVKDVDGLYERDPARADPPPLRFATAHWDDALAADGSIVQHKAVRFARAHGLEFELGDLAGTRPTRIGAGPLATGAAPARARPLRVALLGLGTVGEGVRALLADLPRWFVVTRAVVRDVGRPRNVPTSCVVTDAAGASFEGVDVVVEALGGVEPARELVERALDAGAHVVTANKALSAARGRELRARGARAGRRFLDSAAVGGSLPLLERLAAAGGRRRRDIASVRGVLNGTTNFVLDRLGAGAGLDDALREARARGFAEASPERDLDGRDAADKLVLVARALGHPLAADEVRRDPCDDFERHAGARARRAASAGRALRQVASLEREGAGWRARVTLSELEAHDPLFGVRAERNGAVVARTDGRVDLSLGTGAGRWPTSEAVLGDLMQLARERCVAQNWNRSALVKFTPPRCTSR